MAIMNGTSGNDYLGGSASIDELYGFEGVDSLLGRGGDDLLDGGAGSDILTGGTGNDTFQGTAAELDGDTITDFSVGDRILITDGSLVNWSFHVSGNTLVISFTGGSASITLGNVPTAGPLVAMSPANNSGVEIRVLAPPPPQILNVGHPADFNNDGYDDVLWRSSGSTSQLMTFLGQPNGSFIGTLNPNFNLGADWHASGAGDFNGDGYDDLLWRSEDGTVVTFLGQSSGTFVDNPVFRLNPGLDWHVEGTGDFNGDGHDDILWRNDAGTVVTLLGHDNGSFVGNVNFSLDPGLDWHIQGTGDFNGDGNDDILWRNDLGRVVTLLGHPNGSFVGNVNFDLNPGLDWHIIGTGDFNGDGRDDVLWRSDGGAMTSLLGNSDGSFLGSVDQANVNPGSDWYVGGIGDFNGDGLADLLLRDNLGTAIDWLGEARGGFADNSATFNVNPGNFWQLQPEPLEFV